MSGDIPAGMVPWHGGDAAPADWDGGPVLWSKGPMCKPGGFLSWRYCGTPGVPNIIAYTPKPALATERPAPSGDVAGLVERINREMRHTGRGYADRRGELLLDAADALTRLSGEGDTVVVPREPTEAMLEAGAQAHDDEEDPAAIWSAMIAAAPGQAG